MTRVDHSDEASLRVLVADDEPDVRLLLRMGLRHHDISVVAYTAVAGDFVRREMSRLGIPLLLKSGDAAPLAEALHRARAEARTAS